MLKGRLLHANPGEQGKPIARFGDEHLYQKKVPTAASHIPHLSTTVTSYGMHC